MEDLKSSPIPNAPDNLRDTSDSGASDSESPDYITRISPTGDVILVVGESDQEKRLLVESSALRRSSRVFAAMFSGPWLESEGLLPPVPKENPLSSPKPSAITLPEDNPEAMKVICHLVHPQYPFTPAPMTVQAFLTIAIHIDKYGFGRALQASCDSWWRPFLNGVDDLSDVDLIHLIAAAYLLRDNTVFPKLTISLVARNPATDSYTDFAEDPFLAVLLPPKLFGMYCTPRLPPSTGIPCAWSHTHICTFSVGRLMSHRLTMSLIHYSTSCGTGKPFGFRPYGLYPRTLLMELRLLFLQGVLHAQGCFSPCFGQASPYHLEGIRLHIPGSRRCRQGGRRCEQRVLSPYAGLSPGDRVYQSQGQHLSGLSEAQYSTAMQHNAYDVGLRRA